MYKLIIGNKNYSSWSLRAWLYMRESKIDFEEIRIPMFTPDWKAAVARYSPAGRVPVLVHDDHSVWDSLAIVEYLLEQEPKAVGWPQDPRARAMARSITYEMHAGFMAVREELPQNIRRRFPHELNQYSSAAQSQIARIVEIWTKCRNEYAATGPWLFGRFSIADVFYAPVALRFSTYDLDLGPIAKDYLQSVWLLESIQEWRAASAAEAEAFDFVDNLKPIDQSPLSPG